MSLAGLAVATIILIDLATGQGPPALNSFIRPGPPGPVQYQPGPPPPPAAYMSPRADYGEQAGGDYSSNKDYKDEKKKESGSLNPFAGHEHKKDKYDDKSTPAPGVFSTFSNSMNDAWKSLTALGRQTRSAPQETEKVVGETVAAVAQDAAAAAANSTTNPASPKGPETSNSAGSSGRSIDDWEMRQYSNQGYIFFKVPKNLICNGQY